jgi:hypothetical protein
VACEERIAKLEHEKVLALETLSTKGKPKHAFKESFGHWDQSIRQCDVTA